LRLARVIVLGAVLLTFSGPARADVQLARSLGDFQRVGDGTQSSTLTQEGLLTPDGLVPVSIEGAEYAGNKGSRILVEIIHFRQDAEAYELLSWLLAVRRQQNQNVGLGSSIGTAGFSSDNEIGFFKGPAFVRIKSLQGSANLEELARFIGENLDKGENDIPVLIKHLPNPEESQKNAIYLNSFTDLEKLGLRQPVLSAVQPGGNASAALGTYGPSKVLIVEFNTPQLALENDQRIIGKIHELWRLGQPAPTAYRRVGNYSVFVFEAPDEQTAKQLIDQVKYEQVVQWLGENPNIFKEAERRYINTTLGVLIAVVKASGYALIGCVGMGALLGGLLFTYRRARQKNVTAFSDAGGMLRLNLDELTPETNPGRLLRERN
jgi:hypothetical protein